MIFKNQETHKIAKGDAGQQLGKLSEDLRFAVDEGYSDEAILSIADQLQSEIGRTKSKVRSVL